MKYTDVQDLIRAHYESEDKFRNVVDRIINAEIKAGKEISANKIGQHSTIIPIKEGWIYP